MQRDLILRWLEQLALVIRRLLYGPGPVDIELAEHRLAEALQYRAYEARNAMA